MKKLLLLLLLSITSNVFAQTLSERHQRIRAAAEKKDFALAFQELQSLRKTDARIFELNNYDYLLGRAAEKRRDVATATAAFQSVVQRKSVLQAYALWHLAQLWRASGNLMLERTFLEELLTVAPDSLLNEAAALRLARSFFESKDYAAVIQNLKSQIQNPAINSQVANSSAQTLARAREKQVLLGEAYLRGGDRGQAREVFFRLVNQMPKPESPDDFALAAVRGLDEMDAARPADYGKIAPQLTDGEHLRRAIVYQFNRAFAEAALHYEAIAERYPNSAITPDAFLRLGRMASLQDRFDEAIVFFERVQGEFPNSPQARDALSFEAATYARLGNTDEAVNRYKIFIAKYIDNASSPPENPERPFLNIIDALRDKGRDADALGWVAQARERFKNQLPAAQALFSQTRVHLSQGDWVSTLRDLAELETAPDVGDARVAGGTNQTELAFLKAFCLEQTGRFDEAINAYLTIPDGRGEYYGGRATERLRNLLSNDKARDLIGAKFNLFRVTALQAANLNDAERARQNATYALRLSDDPNRRREMLDVARRAYAVLPVYKNVPTGEILVLGRQKIIDKTTPVAAPNSHQAVADELLFLGLEDEAAPELELQSLKSKAPSPSSKLQNAKTDQPSFTLAVISKRGDLAYRAVAYAEPLWRSVPADYLVELAPREAIELLYPVPYADSLREFAAPRQVDPRFVLAIMRQESRYRPDVKSSAAARGLMQFIPSTAALIAGQLNQPNFVANDLFNPPTAVLFGSQYVRNIFREFPAQPPAVAAAYNGGEANMMRWLLRSKSTDPDRYVAEIQFSQSKDYVYKVLANYRVYQTLYDERLQRK